MIMLFSAIAFSQSNVKTVYLSSGGDSSYRYTCRGEWVEILAIDSTDADTVNVYYPSVGTGVAPIGVIRSLATGSDVTEITPTTGINGNYYVLWAPYPRTIDFYLESTGGAAEMWLTIVTKP